MSTSRDRVTRRDYAESPEEHGLPNEQAVAASGLDALPEEPDLKESLGDEGDAPYSSASPEVEEPSDPLLDEKKGALRTMKVVATGFFVAAAVAFVVAHSFDGYWWGLAEAIAEAAMVGALADWFAVTALFRRPLGLPIPHTAIIPENKARIGKTLGQFIERNFLNAKDMAQEVDSFDVAEYIGNWLNHPRNIQRVRRKILEEAPGVLKFLRDPRVADFVQENAMAQLEEVDLKPVLRRAIIVFMRSDNPQRIVERVLVEVSSFLQDNQQQILRLLEKAFPPIINIVKGPSKTEESVRRLLEQMVTDPDHKLRQRLVVMILVEARRQRSSEEARRWIDQMRSQVVNRPETARVVSDIWQEMVRAIAKDLERESESRILNLLEGAATKIAREILSNEALRDDINNAVREQAAKTVKAHGFRVARLIEKKVDEWGENEIVDIIEPNVGRDLQFIRINGTLVGGLIGGVIYVLTYLL